MTTFSDFLIYFLFVFGFLFFFLREEILKKPFFRFRGFGNFWKKQKGKAEPKEKVLSLFERLTSQLAQKEAQSPLSKPANLSE